MFEKITVFAANKVITVTEAMPTAEAVAVADGRIISVGTLESLKPGDEWGDPQPRWQPVMIGLPGSIDSEWLIEVLEPHTPSPTERSRAAYDRHGAMRNGVLS